jgi:uncharacterized surface protein with fasciclin (FAS1) repeats
MRRPCLSKVLLALFCVVGSCQKKPPVGAGTAKVGPVLPLVAFSTFREVLQQDKSLSQSMIILKVCDLEITLNKGTVKTFWIPTNEAWKKYLKSNEALSTCTQDLKLIFKHHMSADLHARDALAKGMALMSLAGQKIFVNSANALSLTDKALTASADLDATSRYLGDEIFTAEGVVQIVDTILVPDSLGNLDAAFEKRPYLSEVVQLIKSKGLELPARNQNNITALAPTNQSFFDFNSPVNKELLFSHLLSPKLNILEFSSYPTKVLNWAKNELVIERDEAGEFSVSFERASGGTSKLKSQVLESVSTLNGQLVVLDQVLEEKSNAER